MFLFVITLLNTCWEHYHFCYGHSFGNRGLFWIMCCNYITKMELNELHLVKFSLKKKTQKSPADWYYHYREEKDADSVSAQVQTQHIWV